MKTTICTYNFQTLKPYLTTLLLCELKQYVSVTGATILLDDVHQLKTALALFDSRF